MGNGTGGEIFAKTAKTPPLQSGVGGDIIAIQIRPLPSSMETRKLYNDAARRVATSSEARKNRFETAAFQEGDRGERPVWGQSFWGNFPCLRVNRFQSCNPISRRA